MQAQSPCLIAGAFAFYNIPRAWYMSFRNGLRLQDFQKLSYSGEEQRIVNRLTESPLAAFASDFDITVCAARKRIRVPVMKICGAKLRFNLRFFEAEQ